MRAGRDAGEPTGCRDRPDVEKLQMQMIVRHTATGRGYSEYVNNIGRTTDPTRTDPLPTSDRVTSVRSVAMGSNLHEMFADYGVHRAFLRQLGARAPSRPMTRRWMGLRRISKPIWTSMHPAAGALASAGLFFQMTFEHVDELANGFDGFIKAFHLDLDIELFFEGQNELGIGHRGQVDAPAKELVRRLDGFYARMLCEQTQDFVLRAHSRSRWARTRHRRGSLT